MVVVHIMDNRSNYYSLGLYEKAMPSELSWKEKLSLAKSIGFDFVEVSIDETDEKLSRLSNTSAAQEIKDAIITTGIPVKSMCLSGHRKYPLGSLDDATRDKGLQIFYDAVDLAFDLGVRTIQLAGYDVYYEQSDSATLQRFEEYLIKGIKYASSKQVTCAFETMETDFMNTIEKAMVYVEKIKSPFLQIYPDLGNLTNANCTSKELDNDIEKGRGHISAVHLKETIPGVFREVPFNTGHVNFSEGIRAFWNQGVRSFVCECWYTDPNGYIEELKFNYDFLKEIIEIVRGEENENRT